MADNRSSGNEPFFWIKTGRDIETPAFNGVDKSKAKIRPPRSKVIHPQSRTQSLPATESARAGLQPGWTRATFIIREEYLSKLKDKAYWDRKAIKSVLDEILGAGLAGISSPESAAGSEKTKK
jgi:hypothetical protein